MRLTIQTIPPSVNQLERMHWAVRKKMRTNYAREIFLASLTRPSGDRIVSAYQDGRPRRLSVHITVYRPRLLDPDNATGGVKPIIDAMRDIHLLHNDHPKWIALKVTQVRDRTNPRVEIDVTEAIDVRE